MWIFIFYLDKVIDMLRPPEMGFFTNLWIFICNGVGMILQIWSIKGKFLISW